MNAALRLLLPGKSELTEGCSWKSLGNPLEVSMEIQPDDHIEEAWSFNTGDSKLGQTTIQNSVCDMVLTYTSNIETFPMLLPLPRLRGVNSKRKSTMPSVEHTCATKRFNLIHGTRWCSYFVIDFVCHASD